MSGKKRFVLLVHHFGVAFSLPPGALGFKHTRGKDRDTPDTKSVRCTGAAL